MGVTPEPGAADRQGGANYVFRRLVVCRRGGEGHGGGARSGQFPLVGADAVRHSDDNLLKRDQGEELQRRGGGAGTVQHTLAV